MHIFKEFSVNYKRLICRSFFVCDTEVVNAANADDVTKIICAGNAGDMIKVSRQGNG